MGRLQQRRRGEDGRVFLVSGWISSAARVDDLLLLSHCLRTAHKGTIRVSLWSLSVPLLTNIASQHNQLACFCLFVKSLNSNSNSNSNSNNSDL